MNKSRNKCTLSHKNIVVHQGKMRDMGNKLKPCKKIVQTSKKVQGQTEDNFTLMLIEEFLPIEVL